MESTADPHPGVERLLAGVRRMAALAQTAVEGEAVVRSLAVELLAAPGADEIHVHTLSEAGDGHEHVDIYMFDGASRLSYVVDMAERPPGVALVARTGEPFAARGAGDVAAAMPRLARDSEIASVLALPMSERGVTAEVVVLARSAASPFTVAEVEYCAAMVEQASTALALCRARAEAGTDPVTGAMNRRAMHRRLDEEIGRARRTGGPLSCLLVDLDDFKRVNDVHGHPAGDATLRGVVQALISEFRSFDRVARYGGDEFVVILPNADLENAVVAGARALDRLALVAGSGEGRAGVAASVGAAQWQQGLDADALLAACDEALLRSKREGKGRVTSGYTPSV
ncbi:MAG TPA: GGDEF domain-containing protein [Solirubrobacteraceae bacterium]|nr:GGDEF domain-containing protein [Solirubrobacteraceae bacterium]